MLIADLAELTPGAGRLLAAVADRTVVAPGVFDALSARAARAAGCRFGYLTPFGFQGGRIAGAPGSDWTGYVELVRQLVEHGVLDVVVDLCTGIEGDRDPGRLVAEAAEAGAAAVVLEDRERFGRDAARLDDTAVARRIDEARSVAAARPLVAVRTDLVREDLGRAIERCARILDAGADLVMPLMTPYLHFPDTSATRSERDRAYARLTARIDPGHIVLHSPHGRHVPLETARETGYAVELMPQLLAAGAFAGMRAALADTLAGTDDFPLDPPDQLAAELEITTWLRARW